MHQIRLHMLQPQIGFLGISLFGTSCKIAFRFCSRDRAAALGSPIVSEFYYQKAKQMIEERTLEVDSRLMWSSGVFSLYIY